MFKKTYGNILKRNFSTNDVKNNKKDKVYIYVRSDWNVLILSDVTCLSSFVVKLFVYFVRIVSSKFFKTPL
jgi:hypothetical protein